MALREAVFHILINNLDRAVGPQELRGGALTLLDHLLEFISSLLKDLVGLVNRTANHRHKGIRAFSSKLKA